MSQKKNRNAVRSVKIRATLILISCIWTVPSCESFQQSSSLWRKGHNNCLHASLHSRQSNVRIDTAILRNNKRNLGRSLQMVSTGGIEELIFSVQSSASDLISSRSFAEAGPASLAVLYFAGLLTSFSPCSLGLLPLTLSYISTAAGERSDKSSFLPTLAFAAGLAVIFCGFGLVCK